MGKRLHYAKVYEIEYDYNGRFNYAGFQIGEFLDNHNLEMCNVSEDGDMFELEKSDVADFLETYKEYKGDETKVFDDYTRNDLYTFFETAHNNTKPTAGYILFSWF